MLYDRQAGWSSLSHSGALDKFNEYAGELGLDVDTFKDDVNSEEVRNRVNRDFNSALAANISSTPTLFLNGELLRLSSFDQLKQLIIIQFKLKQVLEYFKMKPRTVLDHH